jgi:hypothetical protein
MDELHIDSIQAADLLQKHKSVRAVLAVMK